MIHHAIWVAEQQLAWSKRNFKPTKDNEGVWHITTSPFYLIPFAAISSAPYAMIATTSSNLAWQVETNAMQVQLARSYGIRRIGARSALKFGLTKVASRAVPGLGYALLAVDMWHVGKWIGEKTNPFDS